MVRSRTPIPSILLLLALLSLLSIPPAAASAYRVGILDLEGRGGLNPEDWAALNESVFREVQAALPEGPWETVPREVLRFQLKKLEQGTADCLEDDCLLELGNALDLNLLVVSYFRQSASEDRVLLKLYDMDRGQLEGFTRVSGSTLEALQNSLPPSCHRLLYQYRQRATLSEKAAVDMEEATEVADEGAAWQAPEGSQSLVGRKNKDLTPPPPPPMVQEEQTLLSGWGLGLMISTYSGPSHADLLTSINRSMGIMSGGTLDSPFSDFPVSTPISLRLSRQIKPPLTLAATYTLSQYFTKTSYSPHEWDSDRSLETNLHEFIFALQYALDFVGSNTVVPYMGGGINFIYADSQLEIGLVNTPGATIDGEDGSPVLPDQSIEVNSQDLSAGAVGFLGILYRIAPKLALQAELQGQMGQISQNFDYSGSLQYIRPGVEGVGDPEVDDILWGSYPLDLNGLKLSVGILFEF